MGHRYEFEVDDIARAFCDEIVAEMVRLFGVASVEAVARLNTQWRRNDFKKEDVRYHEPPDFWANDIYYGSDSKWWANPGNLKPKPY